MSDQSNRKQIIRYWFKIFAFLFSMFSIGTFLWTLAGTDNLLLALGESIVITSGLFAGLFAIYGYLKGMPE